MNYPTYYYRNDNNSVVLIGKSKITDTDYAILALTYSLDSDTLIEIDTLRSSKLLDSDIKLSDNDKFIAIAEKRIKDKNTKTNRKIEKQIYDVFTPGCKKIYSVQLDVPKSADTNFKIFNSGELVQGQVVEKGKNTQLIFSKFDTDGKLAGTAEFSASIDDIYSYKPDIFLLSPTNEIYCVCSKVIDQMEGFVIFKLDFLQKTCLKIVDENFDKSRLAKIYKSAELNYSMIESKKIKPLARLENFDIHSAYVDSSGIYVLMEDTKIGYHQIAGMEHETVVSYAGENIITMSYNFNGNEIWSTPIKRDALYIDMVQYGKQINFYNPNGSGIEIKTCEDENYINMMVPSMGRIYATRINKTTGKETTPILLNDEKLTYTNSNCLFWIDSDHVVITTMKGIYTVSSKNVIHLNSMVLKY
jgi:hypothetical protein